MAAHRTRTIYAARIACIGLLALSSAVHSQSPPAAKSTAPLIRQMAGIWKVESRMWPGPDAKPIDLPPAVAHRRIVGDAFMQEEMSPSDESGQDSFTRVAYLSYNSINQQYEYFSLDSRLPQMMSYVAPGANRSRDGQIELRGTSFVAPAWGEAKNVPFMYRLTIGAVEDDRQTVRLFLTEQKAQAREFLAFEYVYVRER